MFDTPRVRPEYRQQWASRLKVAANFFKHARHDEGATLKFDPALNEYVLMASCKGLSRMGIAPAMEELLAFTYWMLFTMPERFDDGQALLADPKVQMIQKLASHGPDFFLRNFEEAWKGAGIPVNSSQSVTVRLIGWATVTGGGAAAACGAGLSSQPDKATASKMIIGLRPNDRLSIIRAKRSDFSVALNSLSPEQLAPIDPSGSRDQAKFALRGQASFQKNKPHGPIVPE